MFTQRPTNVGANSTAVGRPYAMVVLLQVHWFIRLRWVFFASTFAVLAIERFVLPTVRRPAALLWAVLCIGAVNCLWIWISSLLRRQLESADADQRRAIRSGQIFVSAQIAVDLLLLTWIIGLTGGVENPMSVFYLFHIAISGLILPTWQAAIQACWAALLYAGMCLGQAQGWLPYDPFLPHLGAANLYMQGQHVTAVVAIVTLAIFGSFYFTDRIGKVMDRREDMLNRANAALQASQRSIEELQRRRSRFMQTAAHQLKSPLAMVQTLANLIRDGIVTDEHGIHATCDKIARRASDGMQQVTELLALARVQEADTRRQRASLCDVGEVATEVCRKFAAVASEKQIRFEPRIPQCPDLRAYVNREDLVDCIGNLVDNAIKYTPGGGTVTVTVVCGGKTSSGVPLPPPPASLGRRHRSVDDYVYVTVQDTGIGIAEQATSPAGSDVAHDSLFDAFRRGKTAIEAGIPGTGLGLSIVREVVEQAGGYIHVTSRPGAGATFTVCFPAERGGPVAPLRTAGREPIIPLPQASGD